MKRKTRVFLCVLFSILGITLFSFSTLAEEETPPSKVIYLTFDDGPGGKVTTDTLDVLKKEDVKATFFLIGDQIKDQEEILNRMVDEGHSLGLHSMSHNRGRLYSSNDNFLKEMLNCQKEIENACGVKATILRFPFGCNNNTYHLKESLVNTLHENNLRIYDWNVDSTDGANPSANPYTFLRNSKSDKETIILLMHCGFTNKTSPLALSEIIHYYKEKGYTFKAITEETEEMFHYLNH